MDTFRGCKIKGKKGMLHWGSLLKQWQLSIEKYCRIMNGEDAPYIYNERANISILAGSAWRSGGIALEEFQGEKGYKNKAKKPGRNDLWILSNGKEDLIEAKFHWICMGSDKTPGIIEQTMTASIEDAKRSRANDKVRTIGVGFFPVYKNRNRINDMDKLIKDTINEFLEYDYHALAWCFPKQMREHFSYTHNALPGLFLLAKNADY